MNIGNNQQMLNQSLIGSAPELLPDPEMSARDIQLLSVNRRMDRVVYGIIFGADCALAAIFLTLACQSDKCTIAAEVLAIGGLGIMLTGAGYLWFKFGD